jgi:hypothetical protein
VGDNINPHTNRANVSIKPPFEIYRECDIADANGHVCTCENPEIAKEILAALTAAAGVGEWQRGYDAGMEAQRPTIENLKSVTIERCAQVAETIDPSAQAIAAAIRALKDEP